MLSVLTAALVSLALGYWLSGVLVSQITDLARAVGRLKPGDAAASPLPAAGQDPEVATLARALDAYRASMDADDAARAGIHREREPRAAHAAHRDPDELRAAARRPGRRGKVPRSASSG